MILLAAVAAVVGVLLVAGVAWQIVKDARADERVSMAWRDEHTRDERTAALADRVDVAQAAGQARAAIDEREVDMREHPVADRAGDPMRCELVGDLREQPAHALRIVRRQPEEPDHRGALCRR